jgi:hypothetical protein
MKIWFFNDLNCAKYVDKSAKIYREQAPKRLVEVGYGPCLEHYFGYQSPQGYPGICGLIGAHIAPEDLSLQVADNYPELIFAPNPPVGRQALGAAVGDALRHPDLREDTALLIDLDCADALIPWLGAAESVGMLYDISAAPESKLLATVQALTESGIVDSKRWSGMFVFDSRDSSLEDPGEGLIERLGLERIEGASIIS